jgi:phosphoribosylanthranilate isomerase
LDDVKLYVALGAAQVANQRLEMQELLSAWDKRPGDSVNALFLDSSTDSQPGGTGKTFDWEKAASIAKMIRRRFNLVIAGGLSPANVVEAIRTFNPWGVDVSSGVEAQPGKKDPEKIRAFVSAVRNAEHTP